MGGDRRCPWSSAAPDKLQNAAVLDTLNRLMCVCKHVPLCSIIDRGLVPPRRGVHSVRLYHW